MSTHLLSGSKTEETPLTTGRVAQGVCVLLGGGRSREEKVVSACPLLGCQLSLRKVNVGRTIFLYPLLYLGPYSQ